MNDFTAHPARLYFSGTVFAATRIAERLVSRLVWTDYRNGRDTLDGCIERATTAAAKAFNVRESEIIGCGFWRSRAPFRPEVVA